MASITDTRTMNMLTSHVREKVLPVMQNVWWKEVPLLKKMEARGNVKIDGGERIDVKAEVEAGKFEEFDGYDLLTLVEHDPFKGAWIDWNFCHVPLQVSRSDLAKIRGREKLFDLMSNKLDNAQKTMRYSVNNRMYDDGSNSEASNNPFYGLKKAIPYNGNTGTYAGVNRANFSWWQNYYKDVGSAYTVASGVATAIGLVQQLNTYIRKVQQNQLIGTKNLIAVLGSTVMGYLEDLAFFKSILLNEVQDTDLGIIMPTYRRVPLLIDDTIETYIPGADGETDHGIYILNLDFLKWFILTGCNFEMDPWERQQQQFVMVSHIFLAHQMLCTNPRYEAVLFGITAPTIS